jgi:hypothetical protein
MSGLLESLFDFARGIRAVLLTQSGWTTAALLAAAMGGASIALAPLDSDTFSHKYQRTKKKSKVLLAISRVLILAGCSLLSNIYLDGTPYKRIIAETSDTVANIKIDIDKLLDYAEKEGLMSYISNGGAGLFARLEAEADDYVSNYDFFYSS